MDAVFRHPAAAALIDSFASLLEAIVYQARTLEPTTWMLLAIAVASLWMFMVRPPA